MIVEGLLTLIFQLQFFLFVSSGDKSVSRKRW